MWCVLFLDLNNLEYYGYMPKIPKDREGRVEIYRFDVTREHWDFEYSGENKPAFRNGGNRQTGIQETALAA